MAVVDEGIKFCDSNGLCFGNYAVKQKIKVDDFEYNGDIYKVRTHNEVTRLEKNGKLLLESVPGAAILNFEISEKIITFCAEGVRDTRITLELEPETEYVVFIDGVNTGKMKSNLAGKISFSAALDSKKHNIKIEKRA